MNKQRLFVDMDGTLAVFKVVNTLETLYEKGYFLNLEPIDNVLNAVKEIIQNNPEIEVNILSAVLTDSEFALEEKNKWLDRYLPEVDREHRVFPPCGIDKKDFINTGVRETDFLLDDYTHNLRLWQPPARGIKILNGINHTRGTWDHDRLRFDKTAEELAKNIISIMQNGERIEDENPKERNGNMDNTFFKVHANPSRYGTADNEFFVQEYISIENTAEANIGRIVFMGNSDECININEQLTKGNISIEDALTQWNNRDIDTPLKLATALDQFHKDYDAYGYADAYVESQISDLASDIEKGSVGSIIEQLGSILEEESPSVFKDYRYAQSLLSKLKEFEVKPMERSNNMKNTVKNIATLDFVNGLPRNSYNGESKQFARAIDGMNTDTGLPLAREYVKQWDRANTSETFIPKMAILQFAKGESSRYKSGLSLESYTRLVGGTPGIEDYEVVFVERLERNIEAINEKAFLENQYIRFNADAPRPSNYYGHSLSMGDVIVLSEDSMTMKAFYVDNVGLVELPDNFITEQFKAKVATNLDIRVEHDMLKDIHKTGLEENRNILSEINNSRYSEINLQYLRVFDLADKRAILEQSDKLNAIFDFEMMYGGESNSDSITYYDHSLDRVMLKGELLRNSTSDDLQRIVDEQYDLAINDNIVAFEEIKTLNTGDVAFLYSLSNGVDIFGDQTLEKDNEALEYAGYNTSTGEEVKFRYADIEAVKRNDVELHRAVVQELNIEDRQPFVPSKEQNDTLNSLYSAIVTRRKNPNDEFLRADISEKLKSYAQDLDKLHVPFAVQNAVAVAAESPANWEKYNNIVLNEVYQRGYKPQTFVDNNSHSVVIAGHRGKWHTIDTVTIDGKEYFLMEHNTHGDEAASIIVNASGSLILDDVYNGFDDLRDHLENDYYGQIDFLSGTGSVGETIYYKDKESFDIEVSESRNIGRPISPQVYPEKVLNKTEQSKNGLLHSEKLREFLIGLQNDIYSGKQDYFIYRKSDGDYFFITDACGQFDHVAVGTLSANGEGNNSGRLQSIGKNVSHYENNTNYDPIDKLCNMVVDMEYLGHIQDDRVLIENRFGNRVKPTCEWVYALEQYHIEKDRDQLVSRFDDAVETRFTEFTNDVLKQINFDLQDQRDDMAMMRSADRSNSVDMPLSDGEAERQWEHERDRGHTWDIGEDIPRAGNEQERLDNISKAYAWVKPYIQQAIDNNVDVNELLTYSDEFYGGLKYYDAEEMEKAISNLQTNNNNIVRYFKLVKNLDVNLKPYTTMPMYDDAPDMGSFRSTLGVSQPKQGDYLIYSDGEIDFVSVVRDFSEVSFTHKVDIEDLLRKEIVREVSGEVFSLDMDLSSKISELNVTRDRVEMEIDLMKNDKETFSEQDIKEHENDLANIKKQLADIEEEYEAVINVINRKTDIPSSKESNYKINNEILDAPTNFDLSLDSVHEELMRLSDGETKTFKIGNSTYNVKAIFDEKLDGDNYYKYDVSFSNGEDFKGLSFYETNQLLDKAFRNSFDKAISDLTDDKPVLSNNDVSNNSNSFPDDLNDFTYDLMEGIVGKENMTFERATDSPLSSKESNFNIDKLESGTFVVRSDSERFGKQAITFESFSRDECVDYIDTHSEPIQPTYYVIEDLSTWSNNAPVQSEIERFDTIDEAVAKFNEYRDNSYDYSDGKSNLTMGASVGFSELDIVHVRNNENYLVSDFIGSSNINTNKAFLSDMAKLESAIGFEKISLHRNEMGERINEPITLNYKDWNNVFFRGECPDFYTININSQSVPHFHGSFDKALTEYEAAGFVNMKSIGYMRNDKGGILAQFIDGVHRNQKNNLSIDLTAIENTTIARALDKVDAFCEKHNPKVVDFMLESDVYQVVFEQNGELGKRALVEQAGQFYFSTGTAIEHTLSRHNLTKTEIQKYHEFVKSMTQDVPHGEEYYYHFGREDNVVEIKKLNGFKSMVWEDGEKPVRINDKIVWGVIATTEPIDAETQLKLSLTPVGEERSNGVMAKKDKLTDNLTKSTDEVKARDILTAQLQQGIRDVMESNKFRNWCATSGKLYFTNYSFRNAMLTYLQKPESSYVMGFEAWKGFGRQVVAGAESIKIVTPAFAKEYTRGGLYKMIRSNLNDQMRKDPNIPYAVYNLGKSKLAFTVQHNGIMGLMVDGRDVQRFNSEDDCRKFIDRNVLGKEPMYYSVGSVFDISDTLVPEFVWLKSGFKKEDQALNDNGEPIKNPKGAYKIINTAERQGRLTTNLDLAIPEGDTVKMELLFSVLQKISNDKGIPMTLEHIEDKGTSGFYQRPAEGEEGDGKIVISEELLPTEKVAVTFHEITHSKMHRDLAKLNAEMGEKVDRGMREVQAEATAYMTAKNFGIDTETSSFNYLAVWSKGKELKELEKSLDVIYRESKALMKEIEKELTARGLNMMLEPIEQSPMTLDEKVVAVKDSTAFVLDKFNMYDDIATEILQDLENVEKIEEQEIVKEQNLVVITIKTNLSEITKLNEELMKAEDRPTQINIIAKIGAVSTRVYQSENQFNQLTLMRMEVIDENKNTLKRQFDLNPMEVLTALQKEYECMKDLTKQDLSYLASSKFISREYSKLLRNDPDQFVKSSMNQLDQTKTVRSKNDTFVEVVFCETWGENVIFKNGTVAHPKIANKIIEQAEMQSRNLRLVASKNGDYYPYSKCDIVVYTPNDKGGLHAFRTQVDIGDGEQKDLVDHMEQVCKHGKDKGVVLENLKLSTKERTNVNDKILIPKQVVQEHPTSEKEANNGISTQSIAEWKTEIDTNRFGHVEENEVSDKENGDISDRERK